MNEDKLARNIVQRLTNRRAVKLPEMTLDDAVAVIDHWRIPEKIQRLMIMDRPDCPINQDLRDELDFCRATMAYLHECNQWGELDDDTYERLTTPQNYTDDERAALRDHAHRFEPQPFGIDAAGRYFYTLLTRQGTIFIIPADNEQWLLYEP